jgi:hypothetical protein
VGPLAAWGITEGDWTSVWQAVIVVGDPPDGTVRGKFGVESAKR